MRPNCGECVKHLMPPARKQPWCRRFRVPCAPDAKPCRLPEAVKRPSIFRIMWELLTGRFESPRPRHKVHMGRKR